MHMNITTTLRRTSTPTRPVVNSIADSAMYHPIGTPRIMMCSYR
jgi:hypothetical protein